MRPISVGFEYILVSACFLVLVGPKVCLRSRSVLIRPEGHSFITAPASHARRECDHLVTWRQDRARPCAARVQTPR
jgi:hypothetical protein